MKDEEPEKPDEQKDVSIWRNIGKAVFLIIVLVIAWFVLEWLIEGK